MVKRKSYVKRSFQQALWARVAHFLIKVSRSLSRHIIIGRAQRQAFGSERSCLSIAGFDVPHLHLHLIPANSMEDIKFAHAQPATAEDIAASMQKLRQAIAAQGHASEAGVRA